MVILAICGITPAEMMIRMYGGRQSKEVGDYKTNENYLEDIGWKHQGLENIISTKLDNKVSVFRNKSYLYVINKFAKGFAVLVSISAPAPDNLSEDQIYDRKDSFLPELSGVV